MSSPTAVLNKIALGSGPPTSTRKRQRRSDMVDISPTKRQARDEEDLISAVSPVVSSKIAQARPRKSITQLPQVTAPESIPSQTYIQKNTYEPPDSPRDTRVEPREAVRPKPKVNKIIRRLKLGKTQSDSPLHKHKYGELDELNSGAMLTSKDSPAKNTRAKKVNPLEKFKSLGTQQADQPNTKVISMNNTARDQPSAKDTGRGGSVEVEDLESNELEEVLNHGETDEDDDESAKVLQRDLERATKPHRKQQSDKDKARAEVPLEPQEETEESDTGEDREQSRPESSQSSGRPKGISGDERKAKREAEARKRQENAEETEAAYLAEIDERGKRFLEGITDIVEKLGGQETWMKLGSGAKSITVMAARKEAMGTPLADGVWRTIRKLSRIFRRFEDAEEVQVEGLLNKFKHRVTYEYLNGGVDAKRADRTNTAIDLFEQLIPHSTYLLKRFLQGRFEADYKHSWEELQVLVKASISLCETASQWEPKPSALESGIRRYVRNHIKPSLNDILETVDGQLKLFKCQEYVERAREHLAKAQAQAAATREQLLAEMQARIMSRTTKQGGHHQDDVFDIDDLEEALPVMKPPQAGPARLQRQPTEEIPAPDPAVTWNEEENVALLEGLQRFRAGDRFTHILETCPQLARKDLDQCVARAQYYKKAAGKHCNYDWLTSV